MSVSTAGLSADAGFNVASSDEATAARLEQLHGAQQAYEHAFRALELGNDAVAAIEEARAQAAEIVEAAHQEARGIMNAARIKARIVLEQAAATIALVDDPTG